ncbi:hypothetical protein ABPG75_007233 [Micractinium tetrahymenae]
MSPTKGHSLHGSQHRFEPGNQWLGPHDALRLRASCPGCHVEAQFHGVRLHAQQLAKDIAIHRGTCRPLSCCGLPDCRHVLCHQPPAAQQQPHTAAQLQHIPAVGLQGLNHVQCSCAGGAAAEKEQRHALRSVPVP